MSVNLSIKKVPEDLAQRLRRRARKSQRSLQGELMTILREAVEPKRRLSVREVFDEIQSLGIRGESESARLIREDRDGR